MKVYVYHGGRAENSRLEVERHEAVDVPVIVDGALYIRRSGSPSTTYANGYWKKYECFGD